MKTQGYSHTLVGQAVRDSVAFNEFMIIDITLASDYIINRARGARASQHSSTGHFFGAVHINANTIGNLKP